MHKILYYILLLISIIPLHSCQKKKEKIIQIGFSQCTDKDLWRQTMNKEMKVQASLYPNLKFIVLNANGITKKQNIQIRQLINMGVDLLIISPNESEPITAIAVEAFEKGIPTIIIDRKINSKKFTTYIGANNYQIGKSVAEYLGNIFSNNKEILEIRGLDGSSPSHERHQGFMDGLKKYPNLIVKKSVEGEWIAETAKNIAQVEFQKNKYDIVFAHNDVMALGAHSVAPKEIIDSIFFVGIDALPSLGMQEVYKNQLQASFIYPTNGQIAIDIAVDILNNEPFKKNNEFGTSVVDASNIKVLQLQQKQVLVQQNTIEKQISRIVRQEQDFKDQRTLFHITLISLTLLILVTVWLSYYYIKINRKNHELDIKNEAIEKQKKQLEEKNIQILEMNKEVEEATQAKLDFFTNISHEIRTPLTLIKAPFHSMIIQMHQLQIPASLINNLKLINKNTDRLLRIINQLMDFKKVEHGKDNLNISKVNIVELCENIYQSFTPLAEQKSISFSFEKDENHCDLWIDVDKIDKALFNLLSNAFKFTPIDGIIIMRLLTQNSETIQIEVSDTGPGIPEEKRQSIFEPFVQQIEHRSMGTGIGLFLSKRYVELHLGSINIINRKEISCNFVITLPKGKKHFAAEQEIPIRRITNLSTIDIYSTPEDKPLIVDEGHKQNTVLVVEDDIELKQYIITLLNDFYFVKSAENGKQALELIELEHPDIIITDLMMPEMDGLEMTKQLKTNLETSHLPLIMLTAKGTEEQKTEGIETGADAYIEKPFTPDYLLVRIRKLLESRKKIQVYYQQNIVSTHIPNDSVKNSLDKQFLSKLLQVMEANYGKAEFGVENFGQQLNMSRIHLYRKVKALTDYTPSELINKYRLRKSKELLKYQESNILGVALEVGFSSSAYFSKKFKEEFGVTPSEFMNKNKE